jgi:hypothetical protein
MRQMVRYQALGNARAHGTSGGKFLNNGGPA